ncbi:hypothetical protein [Nocardia grenadensis]|uniref:hypothetical protein n=1 Tax=Nocardia grenadensis TaxID=931537 RepID=UPI003D73D0E9
MTFTDRLTAALAASATDDTFDPHAELGELLAGIGMHSSETAARSPSAAPIRWCRYLRRRYPVGPLSGHDEQVWMSQTPGLYRIVLMPRGSDRPE